MDWLFPAVLSTMVATLLLCAAYGYLYVVYRERHLGFWATAWGIYVVRYVALLYAIARGQTPLVYFINMSAIIAALFFLYRGTTEFIGERSTRPWLVAFGAVEVWTGIAIFGGLSFYHLTIPLFGFMAMLSLNLGLLNLLPIPVLDGGHLLFYFAELLSGRPVPEKIQALGYQVGLFLVLGIMFLALYNDFSRL